MRLRLFTQKEIFLAFLGLMFFCASAFFLHVFLIGYSKSFEKKIISAKIELERAQSLIASEDELERAEEEFGLDDRQEQTGNSAVLMSSLENMAKDSGINVLSFRPEAGTGPDAAAISFEGEWKDVMQFLSAAQARPNYFDIRQLRIIRKSSIERVLSVECILSKV